jgi:hypothetical protein
MGKETEFSRPKVAPVVAEISGEIFSDIRRLLYKKIRDGFKRNSFGPIRLPQLGLT